MIACLGAAIGGMLVAAQGPIYARLSEGLRGTSLAAVFLACLSATLVAGLLVVGAGNWRAMSGVASLPPWVWLGGLLGACHVVISMHAIPLVGVGAFLVLVICGNSIGAVIYDHFGAFGRAPRPLTVLRLVGLMVALLGDAHPEDRAQQDGAVGGACGSRARRCRGDFRSTLRLRLGEGRIAAAPS